MPDDAPLIYTKHGNVPVDSLTLGVEWKFGPLEGGFPVWIACREFYTDKATGEVVKDGTHVYGSKGVSADGVAAPIGG